MTDAQGPQSPQTTITTGQIVVGAGAVLMLALGLAVYSEREQPPNAVERTRRQMIDTTIEACRRYDKPDETELDEACSFLLKDENPL